MRRGTTRGATLGAVLLLLMLAAPVGAASGGEALKPDPELQASIARAVSALSESSGPAGRPAQREELQPLLQTQGEARVRLLQQLAVYLTGAGGTEEAMGAALLIHALEFSTDEKLAAVLPHLDGAEPALFRVLVDILSTIDRPDGGAPDFTAYMDHLRRSEGPEVVPLVAYMYAVEPAAAVRAMLAAREPSAPGHRAVLDEVEAVERLRQPGDVSGEALRRALEPLSRHARWWVRLYAAQMVARTPAVQQSRLATRLAADPHPLVRSALRGTGPAP